MLHQNAKGNSYLDHCSQGNLPHSLTWIARMTAKWIEVQCWNTTWPDGNKHLVIALAQHCKQLYIGWQVSRPIYSQSCQVTSVTHCQRWFGLVYSNPTAQVNKDIADFWILVTWDDVIMQCFSHIVYNHYHLHHQNMVEHGSYTAGWLAGSLAQIASHQYVDSSVMHCVFHLFFVLKVITV